MAQVVLIGLRATGKTTLARALGQRFAVPWHDADVVLERAAGATCAEVIARDGIDAFRQAEHDHLRRLLLRPGDWVLATGGGVVEREDNRRLLLACPALVVWLKAPADLLVRRLSADAGGRPSLTGAGVAAEVPVLMARRTPWYESVADLVVNAAEPLVNQLSAVRTALSAGPGAWGAGRTRR